MGEATREVEYEQVLLGQRSDNGCWSVPAGIVEPGTILVLGEADPALRGLFEARSPELILVRDTDFGVTRNDAALGGLRRLTEQQRHQRRLLDRGGQPVDEPLRQLELGGREPDGLVEGAEPAMAEDVGQLRDVAPRLLVGGMHLDLDPLWLEEHPTRAEAEDVVWVGAVDPQAYRPTECLEACDHQKG